MSGNGAVWGRVRSRLRAFPERLSACGAEAAAYGRCVQASTAQGGHPRKDLCAREFKALRSCFLAALVTGACRYFRRARRSLRPRDPRHHGAVCRCLSRGGASLVVGVTVVMVCARKRFLTAEKTLRGGC